MAVENSIEFGVGAKVSMEAQTFSRVAPLGLDKKKGSILTDFMRKSYLDVREGSSNWTRVTP